MSAIVNISLIRSRQIRWPPFVDDFAGHSLLPIHQPDKIINVIEGSYTHVHTLPHPKWHKTKYTNFVAMNKQREMRFINNLRLGLNYYLYCVKQLNKQVLHC
jgi:hypothetical protein